MSARRNAPPDDDESETSIYDPTAPRDRKPTTRGLAPQRAQSLDQQKQRLEMPTPTEVDAPVPIRHDRSEPIRVISMKAPDVDSGKVKQRPRVPQQVVLRPLSSLGSSEQAQRPLERIAPPRDAREVRARRLRDYVIWGSLVVIVGCAVMIAVWFIAR